MRVKVKDKIKTTIRVAPAAREKYIKLYSSFYKGAEIAAAVFPFLRTYALERLREEITPEDMQIANMLIPNEYLVEELMIDPVTMIRTMINQQNMYEFEVDFESFKIKIGDIHPIHLYFLFSEIRRYREIQKDVPTYSIRQFFNEDMY